MENLHANAATGFMDGLGHYPVLACFFRGCQFGAALACCTFRVRRDAARDDQTDPAQCAFCVERSHSFKAPLSLFQAGVHGAHQHPVG